MPQRQPNVVVFFTDQQRWDTSGLHGNPLDLMPNFDRMAQRGTHLYHSFTCQPVCGPARSCLQTGRYATETGCFRNGIPLPAGAKTLAHHFNAAGYEGMVKRLDEALGRLLDAIDSLDLQDDTVVLCTSDHGCHFKTRNTEYKRSCHEGSIRVPAALRGPGFDGGGQVRQLTSLIDLPPTLLNAAGLPVPPEMRGRSVLPLTRGERAGW